MHITIHHRTAYRYDKPVFLTTHLFRLRPSGHSPAQPEAFTLTVTPSNIHFHWQQDVFGNFAARVDFMAPTSEMSVDVTFSTRLPDFNPFNFFTDEYALTYPFGYPETLCKDLFSCLEVNEYGPRLAALVEKARTYQGPTINMMVNITAMIKREVAYTIRLDPGIQTSEQTLAKALGSCRDSAWLLVQLLRHLGLASRFVSGYLVQLSDSGGGDTVDLHAWTEVFLPGTGWLGLDPTSGLFAGNGHIPLACTPRPEDAAPVQGTTDPCESTLVYQSSVTRRS
ncbi:transglutaminase family protein [Hufsiella ginkgonis]|uniref:Transglutaminase n=1 Tax=Hufsiella ginkgonis TaxID=2695274 RepID=A0A7K1Y257_9SPHI|nr:transglutaminase family protein [Hufsiella ginkgonis]MXV16766.1 transglutaminase [Hufsiella ginkgonis]